MVGAGGLVDEVSKAEFANDLPLFDGEGDMV